MEGALDGDGNYSCQKSEVVSVTNHGETLVVVEWELQSKVR